MGAATGRGGRWLPHVISGTAMLHLQETVKEALLTWTLASTPHVFDRLRWSTFADFREFENWLRKQRSLDEQLNAALRAKSAPWMKRRNEEIYPVWNLARHLGLPDTGRYRLTAEGAATDVELDRGNGVLSLQVTTAGPIWPDGPANWGADHALHMEQLNRAGESSGWGPYVRLADGSIVNRDQMISTAERDCAYLAGLRRALQGKHTHQQHDCDLIVYASAYDQAMTTNDFQRLASLALSEHPSDNFRNVHVLAASSGYYVCKRPEEAL